MGKGPRSRPSHAALSPSLALRPHHGNPGMSDITEKRKPRKIRYRESEWTRIVARARECRMPPARYVREVSLGVVPKARRNRVEDRIIVELGRIGNNLNQLARLAHSRGHLLTRDELSATLEELLAVVRRIG